MDSLQLIPASSRDYVMTPRASALPSSSLLTCTIKPNMVTCGGIYDARRNTSLKQS